MPVDYQLDSFHKLEFYPKVFRNLGFIRSKLDFEFVMVTNQDGLGTSSFPEDTFWPVHNLVLKTLEGEGIIFDDILIDRSFPEDHVSTRKPGTGMMGKYLTGDYDLANSFVIGNHHKFKVEFAADKSQITKYLRIKLQFMERIQLVVNRWLYNQRTVTIYKQRFLHTSTFIILQCFQQHIILRTCTNSHTQTITT